MSTIRFLDEAPVKELEKIHPNEDETEIAYRLRLINYYHPWTKEEFSRGYLNSSYVNRVIDGTISSNISLTLAVEVFSDYDSNYLFQHAIRTENGSFSGKSVKEQLFIEYTFMTILFKNCNMYHELIKTFSDRDTIVIIKRVILRVFILQDSSDFSIMIRYLFSSEPADDITTEYLPEILITSAKTCRPKYFAEAMNLCNFSFNPFIYPLLEQEYKVAIQVLLDRIRVTPKQIFIYIISTLPDKGKSLDRGFFQALSSFGISYKEMEIIAFHWNAQINTNLRELVNCSS